MRVEYRGIKGYRVIIYSKKGYNIGVPRLPCRVWR